MTEVLVKNTCAAQTSSTEPHRNECALGEEQTIPHNQCTLELSTSQESNQVAISQSTSNDTSQEVVMDTEPLQFDDGRYDNSGSVLHEPPVVEEVVDTYSVSKQNVRYL